MERMGSAKFRVAGYKGIRKSGPKFGPLFNYKLSARNLDLVPQLGQYLRHALTVLSLDFDRAIFDRPACAAFLLEFFSEGFQVIFREN